jgi:NADPH2:quinone reductase
LTLTVAPRQTLPFEGMTVPPSQTAPAVRGTDDEEMRTPQTTTALFGGYSQTLEVRRADLPELDPTQVLVEAEAWALNNADLPALAAAYDEASGTGRPYRAGYEVAGHVVAIGTDVTSVSVGDQVAGTTTAAFAHLVPVDHRHVLPVPDDLAVADAAALTTALLTEFGALLTAGFRAGHTVAVLGATSAIALVGLQVARELGADRVLGTTRSAERSFLVEAADAEPVVVSEPAHLTELLLAATGGEGVDVVLDHVGGGLLAAALPGTKVGGSLVNIGRLGGASSTVDLDALSYRHLTLRGVSFGFADPEQIGRVLREAVPLLLPAVAAGRIRPVVDSVFAFDDAAAAVDRLRSGQAVGKVVLAR